MTAAVIATPLGITAYGRFLIVATVGNAIGGVFFVALVKYGHVARGAMDETAGLTGGYMDVYERNERSETTETEAVDEDRE